jgi:serine/threonine protein kinase
MESYLLGKYRIEEKIGSGGFGQVFRAVDTSLDRVVAIKILDPMLSRDVDWVRRFKREARIMALLDHPHIVPVYEIGDIDGRLFIAMKYIDGPDLARYVAQNGPFSWQQTETIVQQTATALSYAEQQHVVHRDLKPANILLDARGAMLTDFGLAEMVSDNSMSMTMSGGVVGTPFYLAPEVWEGKTSDKRSDVYALGCIICEMLTGKRLFDGESTPSVMLAHFKPPVFPEKWLDDVPAGLEAVLATAVQRNPDERYADAQALAQALAGLTSVRSPQIKAAPIEQRFDDEQHETQLDEFDARPEAPAPMASELATRSAKQRVLLRWALGIMAVMALVVIIAVASNNTRRSSTLAQATRQTIANSTATPTLVTGAARVTLTPQPAAQEGTAWAAVMSQGTGITGQSVRNFDNYVEAHDSIVGKWDEGFRISELVYADGTWVAVMSAGTNITGQTIKKENSYDEVRDYIVKKWGEGFRISELVYADGAWVAVMSAGTNITGQTIKKESSYAEIRAYIEGKWDEGFRISELVYADGAWVAVMSAGTKITGQTIKNESSYAEVREYIVGRWDDDFRISELVHAGGEWVAVMSQGTGITGQSVKMYSSYTDALDYIQEKMDEQYRNSVLTG